MAETALYLALRKIGLASRPPGQSERTERREDSFHKMALVRFQSRLRRIESELRMMHCFLDQIETRYDNNQVLVSWIAEAQKLGCLVEETVDVYIHILFRRFKNQRAVNFILSELSSVIFILSGQSPMWERQLVVQLIELEAELEHLSKMKKRWVQVASDPEHAYVPSTRDTASLPYHQLFSDFISEEAVVIDEKKSSLLTSRLHDKPHHVVAVHGPGGSGKTTLVRCVYERQRRHFDRCAWISMSGCCSVDDVRIKMMRELCVEADTAITNGDTEYLKALKGVLTDKKFLIVFDDVQVRDGISEVRDLLQEGSRIITITRIKEVATQADQYSIELAGLEDKNALLLFYRVAYGKIPKSTKEKEELYSLHESAMSELKHLVVLCNGLPQLITSLGASLYLKQNPRLVCQQMVKQLAWVYQHNLSLNDTHKYLYVIYNNSPMHLKICLLYCGIFPAGYLLLREKLVRLWIAEGFIEKQQASELEEIAEGYLMELIRRGFLQRVDRDELGRVASCRMPIIVHDLVKSICTKEGFGIASDDVELPQTDTDVRCLFISKYSKDSPADYPHLRTLIASEGAAADSPHLRTLIASESAAADSPHLILDAGKLLDLAFQNLVSTSVQGITRKKYRYLTVLDLQGSTLEILPYGIGTLFNLRYLGLRNTRIRHLPEHIIKLYNMQTLDLKLCSITGLPDWIGKLARLRHLLASRSTEENQRKILMGVRVSKSVKNLRELQTLDTVEASVSFAKCVNLLTQLRSLCISNVESKYCRALFVSVSQLRYLSSLLVSARDGNEDLFLEYLEPQNLEKLVIINGKLDGALTLRFGRQLKSLELSCCKLGNDSLGSLSESLSNLVSLNLHNISGITSIEFKVDDFTELKTLILREIVEVKTLHIPGGALLKLKVLHVESLPGLDVEYFPDLNKIRFINDVFFPQLKNHLGRNDEAESSSSRAPLL